MPECLPCFHLLRFLFWFVLFSSPPLTPQPSHYSMIDRLEDDDVVTTETELQSRQNQLEDSALVTEMTEF